MKKGYVYPLLLIFILCFTACTASVQNPPPETASPSPSVTTASAEGVLTIDEIKKMYSDSKIIKITNVNEDSVLVESQAEGFANRFVLYNLKTGASDNLPTMPEYVVLKRVVNENYFIFEATGKNSESVLVSFPYEIKCFRIANDVNKQDNFYAVDENEYYALDRSVQAGSKKDSYLSDLNKTFSGLEIMFKPGNNGTGMYADAVDIPPIKTGYDSKTNKLTLEIDADQLNYEIKTNVLNKIDDHYYMSAYTIKQKDKKIEVEIDLKDTVKSYAMKMRVDGYPYLIIQFSDSDNTSFEP